MVETSTLKSSFSYLQILTNTQTLRHPCGCSSVLKVSTEIYIEGDRFATLALCCRNYDLAATREDSVMKSMENGHPNDPILPESGLCQPVLLPIRVSTAITSSQRTRNAPNPNYVLRNTNPPSLLRRSCGLTIMTGMYWMLDKRYSWNPKQAHFLERRTSIYIIFSFYSRVSRE